MISERQRIANRANAALSTGPRTAEGKDRSSRNATTHGLCAARIVLSQEEADRYERRLAEWEADFRPGDEVERDLVARAVFATVVLDRIDAFAADGDDAPFDPARDRVVSRHGRRWNRILRQALDDLRSRRATPDQTNPPARLAVALTRPNEPADRPTEAADATEAFRTTSIYRMVCDGFSGLFLVAAALVLGLLATPLGHERDTNGTRTGHEQDTNGTPPGAVGTRTGRRRDTSRTRGGDEGTRGRHHPGLWRADRTPIADCRPPLVARVARVP